jgi:malonyl-CoA O-methyltransferase
VLYFWFFIVIRFILKEINEIQSSFDMHAQEYREAAVMQKEIGARLLERLLYIKLQPNRVLDLGCGPGLFTQVLQDDYPKASVIGYDIAYNMLSILQKDHPQVPLVNGDMMQLPFASASFDLIFANQVIHWAESLPQVFQELYRILTPGGCLLLTTLGPDTFQEIHHAFHNIDSYVHANVFRDMHDIGDVLLATHWQDPVMDVERLTAQYPTVDQLLKSLKAQGVRNLNPQRPNGLMGRQRWNKFTQSLGTSLTYEVIYGHAWKGVQYKEQNETFVAVSAIGRKT